MLVTSENACNLSHGCKATSCQNSTGNQTTDRKTAIHDQINSNDNDPNGRELLNNLGKIDRAHGQKPRF